MSLLTIASNLLTGGALDKVIDLVGSYQEKKLTKEQLEYEIRTLSERQAHEVQVAQIEVNKTEAAHQSLFVAGWRPMLGWVCALGFTVNFLIAPLGTFLAGLAGHAIVFPMADLSNMMPVLLGMLGLGGLRTYEKVQGVSREK